MDNREKLKEKLRKKRAARKNKETPEPFNGETDILKMMDQVNSILRTNPQMVQQISKCVSSVMSNKDLMDSLTGQLASELNVQDQTLESNSDEDKLDASPKDSTQ